MFVSSPIIKSKKANLLDIIGVDCYMIINNYKNDIETYENQIEKIQECINNKNKIKYDIGLSLKNFLEYYNTIKNKLKLEYNVTITKNKIEINYYKYSLNKEVEDLLFVEKIYYTKTMDEDMITLVLKPNEQTDNDYLFKVLLSKSMQNKLDDI